MPTPIFIYDPETDEEMVLKTKWEICEYCHGEGHSTLHGMEIVNWDEWDPEERDEYLHGNTYQTPCVNQDCEGGRERVVDSENNPPELIKMYEVFLTEEAEYRQMREAERRMGA